jgi:phage/plasmid-associated DNA primase
MGKGMSGVLNFALAGLKRLKENDFRFSVPLDFITEKESYKLQNNNVWAFFNECMVQKRGERIRIKDAYEAYKEYVKENYSTLKTCVKRPKFTSMLESTFGVKIIKPQGYKTILDYTLVDEEEIQTVVEYGIEPENLSDDELLAQINMA